MKNDRGSLFTSSHSIWIDNDLSTTAHSIIFNNSMWSRFDPEISWSISHRPDGLYPSDWSVDKIVGKSFTGSDNFFGSSFITFKTNA